MMTRFSGVNAYDQISGAFERGYDRQTRIDDDRAVRRAGQIASGGDLKGASAELMGRGMLKEGIALEELGVSRERERSASQILADGIGGMGAPAPSGAAQGGAKPAGKAASQIDLVTETGGNMSSQNLLSMASRFAASGDLERAEKYMAEADARRTVETELRKKEETKAAQSVFDMYAENDADTRKQFVDQILADENWRSQVPTNILSMLTDGDDRNDDAAMIAWAKMFGADVTALTSKRDAVWEEGLRRDGAMWDDEQDRDRAGWDADLEVKTYGRKAAIDYAYTEKEAELEAKYASETADDESEDYISPIYRNAPPGVKSAIVNGDKDLFEQIDNDVRQISTIADLSDRFIKTVEKYDINTGAGWWDSATRFFKPGEVKELEGISNELVQLMRKPGSGVFTDDDARRAEASVANVNKREDALILSANMAVALSNRAKAYRSFMRGYVAENGHGSLNDGYAQDLWDAYSDDVTVLVGEGKDITINPNIISFDQWLETQKQIERRRQFERDLMGDDEALDAELNAPYGD